MENEMTYQEYAEKVKQGILTDAGNCPVTPLLLMLQGKWKFQIIYELCIKDPIRFGELKKRLRELRTPCLQLLCGSWKRTAWFPVSSSMRYHLMWSIR